jgi:hypothetical protein
MCKSKVVIARRHDIPRIKRRQSFLSKRLALEGNKLKSHPANSSHRGLSALINANFFALEAGFDLLFATNSIGNAPVGFEVHQLMHVVFRSESQVNSSLVLCYPPR